VRAGVDTPARDASTGRRHAVRVFVALHVGAVVAIYAVALAIGGGLASPPLPPQAAGGPAGSQRPLVAQVPVAPPSARPTAAAPAWSERVEVAAPWEGR
jgi:hypothetical protein